MDHLAVLGEAEGRIVADGKPLLDPLEGQAKIDDRVMSRRPDEGHAADGHLHVRREVLVAQVHLRDRDRITAGGQRPRLAPGRANWRESNVRTIMSVLIAGGDSTAGDPHEASAR
ncbi:hypothetical protein NLX85_21725 [Micromonospora sp. A3M-1-15]|uniref:hypothetical protein n=1 Tax=Micromonospora sp. A3M-1-15 TaxID=2962035 RepID=UPI0020B8910E|nr:hypothetical protein [Micromonospora sp. A3M-1-15]MCP3785987.1 hypothetical protein [Micromonospora sp. A3M-1-15]